MQNEILGKAQREKDKEGKSMNCPICNKEGRKGQTIFYHADRQEGEYTLTLGCVLVCQWPNPYYTPVKPKRNWRQELMKQIKTSAKREDKEKRL